MWYIYDATRPFNSGPVRPKKEYKVKCKYGSIKEPAHCYNSGEVFFMFRKQRDRDDV